MIAKKKKKTHIVIMISSRNYANYVNDYNENESLSAVVAVIPFLQCHTKLRNDGCVRDAK